MVRLIKTETVISVLMGHFIKKLLFILLFVGVLIAPANAQNEKNMYSYKKIGNKYIVSINNYNPQNQKSRFQKRKIKKNGKRFVDSLYSLIDLKTI